MSLQQIKRPKTLNAWLNDKENWRVTRPVETDCSCHLCHPPVKFTIEFVIDLTEKLDKLVADIDKEVTTSVTHVAEQNKINMHMWWQEI